MNRTSPPRSAQRVRSFAEIPDPVADELSRYDDRLRDVRGLAAGTRRNHCRIVAQLRKKFAGGVVAMATLRPVDIHRFIARQLGDSPSHSAAAQVASALRSYLCYRAVCGDAVAGLNAAISSPVQWKLASLLRALKPDEVQRVRAHGGLPRCGAAGRLSAGDRAALAVAPDEGRHRQELHPRGPSPRRQPAVRQLHPCAGSARAGRRNASMP